MKQLIIILLFPFVCNAQTDTTYHVTGADSGYVIKYQYDTIPCVMLTCDTSLQTYTHQTIYLTNIDYRDFDYSVRWQFGYYVQVRSRFFLNPAKYLDENKVPLSKNKIVWISK